MDTERISPQPLACRVYAFNFTPARRNVRGSTPCGGTIFMCLSGSVISTQFEILYIVDLNEIKLVKLISTKTCYNE